MSTNLIRASNIGHIKGHWEPTTFWSHHVVLAPMFAIHEGARIQRLRGGVDKAFRWEWSRAAAIEAREVIWNMTGRWNARRPVTLARKSFDDCVANVVPDLADFFNRHEILCLADIAQFNNRRYSAVVRRIHHAVESISALRDTRCTEPVLGSKVLHHYFPSIVPVFDTRYIRKGVMRKATYLDSFEEWRDWRIFIDEITAGGRSMLDFHHYFAFCTWQIGTATPRDLASVRTRFARAFQASAPVSMVKHRDNFLWQMDAKIVEYCAVNEAKAYL